MMPVVDAIVAGVPIPDGVIRDDAGAEPLEFASDLLYGWADSESLTEDGDGSIDRSDFVVMLALTVASTDQAAGLASRATSVALDDAVTAIGTWVRAHRADVSNPPLWEDLQVSATQYAGLRGFEYRGHQMRLVGYRHITS